MLRVDEGGNPSLPLGVRDDLETDRGLSRGLGTVDLADPPAGDPSDADGGIQVDRAGGDGLDAHFRAVRPHAHDRPLPVGALDLVDGGAEIFLLLVGGGSHVGLLQRSTARICGVPF